MNEPREQRHGTTTGILFLILFLDLVGFSIIFPLFPALLDHYLAVEGEESLIGELVRTLEEIAGSGDAARFKVAILFGGVLGSLYSVLQFIFSPLWGRLSDRIGRRPVLLITVAGMAISYLMWAFSGSFTMFIVSRIVGGIMAGNISTATAAMADITSREERAKGMGIIGAAFGLGFILGPAIGGGLSVIRPEDGFFGTNPFTVPALGAFVLSTLNYFWVHRRFGETLPPEKRGASGERPSLNPIALFLSRYGREISLVNTAYFVFLVAFSGMEFTLTFLARERLGWSPGTLGIMFVYVGFLIALVQGGVVRRVTPRFGEKRVALVGLLTIIPGLAGLAYAGSGLTLYLSLAPMAIGSALAIPTMTSLVSLHAPEDRQGAVLGVFRALGALARACGPFLACFAYWQLGGAAPYLLGAGVMILPILLVFGLRRP